MVPYTGLGGVPSQILTLPIYSTPLSGCFGIWTGHSGRVAGRDLEKQSSIEHNPALPCNGPLSGGLTDSFCYWPVVFNFDADVLLCLLQLTRCSFQFTKKADSNVAYLYTRHLFGWEEVNFNISIVTIIIIIIDVHI